MPLTSSCTLRRIVAYLMARAVSPRTHADNMASGSSNPAKPDNATPDRSSDANAPQKTTTDNAKNDEAKKE